MNSPKRILGKGVTFTPDTVFSLNRLALLNPGDVVTVTQGGKTIRTIQLLCLRDPFGSCYVYDCHDPEGVEIQKGLGAKVHNEKTLDLWSLGRNRSPFMDGGKPDRGLAVTEEEEEDAMRYGDDMMNWFPRRTSKRAKGVLPVQKEDGD